MIKTTMRLLTLAAVTAAVVASWPDIRRYLRIRQVSEREVPHPERVPASGRTVYPRTSLAGAPDGTGDFDSAKRGGPAQL
jgi:Family of unknown function (DUF6893)